MKLEYLHPGITVEMVQENTGFELLISDELSETPRPTEDELRVLRQEVDPYRYIIGR